jgi:diketogulonate reductase-like aldo/keto reductase
MSKTADSIPTVALRGGAHIPQLGFGVFQVPPAATTTAVAEALAAGYRHIDTASAYANEAEVGAGIRASGLDRSEVFITTKCANIDHGYEKSRHAFKASLAEEGLVRAIGVSNFNQPHLERIIKATGVTPAINQVELHPYLQQHGLRREHAELGIVTEAWSPLAKGAVVADPTLVEIAASHGKTPAQVVLRWHLELGNVVIPKSVTPERMAENLEVFDFELTADDHAAIDALDRGQRTGPDPDEFIGPQGVLPPK